ncbi:DUF397 domain-containing protein [Streptomyces sp. NPDC056485]|uniref:DUF397 domain-containing protein n=1 Tax=Streptomyces sp. NPDC056485 TaxID=3345834 RepID=UPI00368F0278
MSTTPNDGWFKSSYSGDANGNCLEANPQPAAVYVRDSKQLDEPAGCDVLSFSPAVWSAFTTHTSGR